MAFRNFFGKQYESASNFLDDLEMAFLVSRRDEEEVKLRAFPLVLKDSAKNWFQNLEPGRKTNWETLKETFLSKYGGVDNPEHLWHRISSLHQATSRTYLTYESQFLRLWAEWEASLAEGERFPNFLKKEKFLAGLFPDLQEKVKGKFPETFEEALQIARVKDQKLEYQAHTSRVEHPQGPTMADERLPPAPTTTPEDPHLELLQRVTNQLDNLSINMVQGVRQQQPQPNNERVPNGPRRQPQRRDYFCYNCGEEGHGMYFCPHPRNFNAQAGRGRQQVTPPRARPPSQIQPQILQNPQMVAQPQVLQHPGAPQPVAEIPPLPNNNGNLERDCPSRNQGGRRQQNNYASTSRNVDDSERLFVMQHMMNTMSANASKCDNNVWYVDSSASNHMTNHGEWFKELQALQNSGYVETGDDTAHPIMHTGNVPLSLQDGNVKYLADVLHVPNITKNLVFVGQMVEQGLHVRFNADGLYVEEYKKNGKLIAQGKKVDRISTLDVNIPEVNVVMFAHGSGVVADIEIWHKRIGHANVQKLKTMQSQEVAAGLHVFKVADMQKVCETCQFGKQAKASFPHDKHVSKNVLELVHSNVWGLAKTASMGGYRFYVTFIDDHTRKVWVYFMKEKSEVFTHFQNFKAMAEKQTRKYVQCLSLDGGGEYFSNEFSSFLKKNRI
ncbi:hypothetical protein L7F22_006793 [Adiantum nelumboides]|nr:hypothetical protein [Adiantum nelumboides]